ncbi:MAG: hypothetical protein IPJ19_00695 [Planctomycetes bacterium]|nr:hypothetical protein [Planctomycetota bacterium]
MIAALVLVLAQQAPAAEPAWKGTPAQALARIQELADAAQKDEALAFARELLAPDEGPLWKRRAREWLGLASFSSSDRAAIEYARGVVHAGAKERDAAAESFQRTRADGAGELRLASIYNLGSLALEAGEEWYHKLPEVSGKQPGAQPPAPAPAAGQPGAAAAPDPLAEARKQYLAAREHFVERLRAQWNDADTRADVELVQRRLKRLDEIEQQRKQEEQKKQQQQSKNDKQDDKQKQDQKDDQKPQDSDSKDKDKEKQDQQPQPDPQDKDKPPEQDKDKQDQPKPDEQKQPGDEDKPQPKPDEGQEQQLSKEEMTRLLDKLQQLEEQAAKLRAQIHKARRVTVKKDW